MKLFLSLKFCKQTKSSEVFIGEEDLKEKETSEENRITHWYPGQSPRTVFSCTESQISRGMVGKTEQKAVKKAPELVKCPKVTFPLVEKIKRSDSPTGQMSHFEIGRLVPLWLFYVRLTEFFAKNVKWLLSTFPGCICSWITKLNHLFPITWFLLWWHTLKFPRNPLFIQPE